MQDADAASANGNTDRSLPGSQPRPALNRRDVVYYSLVVGERGSLDMRAEGGNHTRPEFSPAGWSWGLGSDPAVVALARKGTTSHRCGDLDTGSTGHSWNLK